MNKKRVSTYIGIIVFVLIFGGGFYINKLKHQALPDYNKNLTLEGIRQPVEVKRDSFAIPHVYAQNENDLYTAVGYLMAQDRLWQMDFFRRVTQGRLSEIFGKRTLDADVLMRSLRIPEKSEGVLDSSPIEVVDALKAFSNGVNQYIQSHKESLPPEFELLGYKPQQWKPVHSVNLLGFMAWDLSPSWNVETLLYRIASELPKEKYQLLIPVLEKQESTAYPDYEHPGKGNQSLLELKNVMDTMEEMGVSVFTASNSWAVSGEKSNTGKPMLANDMHLGLSAPGIWYQMHQVVKDEMNVTGVLLPGAPFVICGHNDTIAWGMTNMMVDDMDFYHETLHPEDTSKYRVNGQWKDLRTAREQIATKEGDTVIRPISYTHRGPIISALKKVKEPISMRWGGNDFSNELRSVYLLNRAASWHDFKKAVRTFRSINQNITYADINGNIGMYSCGGVPIRNGPGIGVFPGDTTQYDWQGMVPFDELPNTFNPEQGFVSAANNKTVSAKYPYHISHWFALAPRIDRINEVLQQEKKFSVEDFKALQTDFTSKLVPALKPKIMNVIQKAEKFSTIEKEAMELLKQWNGNYQPESQGAAIFEQFYLTFVRNLVFDELGPALYKDFLGNSILVKNLVKNIWAHPESKWCDNVNTSGKKEQFSDIILESFRQTVDTLVKKRSEKPLSWKWGSLHTLTLRHPLTRGSKMVNKVLNMNQGPFQVGGSFHTVGCYGYSYVNPFEVNHGASQRHVYSTANWDSSRTVIPTGISGIPASEHYRDQTRLYINNRYHRDFFSQKEVAKNVRYEMIIEGK